MNTQQVAKQIEENNKTLLAQISLMLNASNTPTPIIDKVEETVTVKPVTVKPVTSKQPCAYVWTKKSRNGSYIVGDTCNSPTSLLNKHGASYCSKHKGTKQSKAEPVTVAEPVTSETVHINNLTAQLHNEIVAEPVTQTAVNTSILVVTCQYCGTRQVNSNLCVSCFTTQIVELTADQKEIADLKAQLAAIMGKGDHDIMVANTTSNNLSDKENKAKPKSYNTWGYKNNSEKDVNNSIIGAFRTSKIWAYGQMREIGIGDRLFISYDKAHKTYEGRAHLKELLITIGCTFQYATEENRTIVTTAQGHKYNLYTPNCYHTVNGEKIYKQKAWCAVREA